MQRRQDLERLEKRRQKMSVRTTARISAEAAETIGVAMDHFGAAFQVQGDGLGEVQAGDRKSKGGNKTGLPHAAKGDTSKKNKDKEAETEADWEARALLGSAMVEGLGRFDSQSRACVKPFLSII